MAPDVDSLIVELRGQRVILDADLATIYGVSTKRLNEQVKRNEDRFPPDFAFQLTAAEKAEVVANCDHLARLKFSPVLPRAFNEHGAIMAATVLNSPRAVQMSVFVVRAFVKTRAALTDTRELARKLAAVETELKSRLDVHEVAIVEVLLRIMKILDPPPTPARAAPAGNRLPRQRRRRALPHQAKTRPVGGWTRRRSVSGWPATRLRELLPRACEAQAGSAKLEQAIKANLRGLGYGG